MRNKIYNSLNKNNLCQGIYWRLINKLPKSKKMLKTFSWGWFMAISLVKSRECRMRRLLKVWKVSTAKRWVCWMAILKGWWVSLNSLELRLIRRTKQLNLSNHHYRQWRVTLKKSNKKIRIYLRNFITCLLSFKE